MSFWKGSAARLFGASALGLALLCVPGSSAFARSHGHHGGYRGGYHHGGHRYVGGYGRGYGSYGRGYGYYGGSRYNYLMPNLGVRPMSPYYPNAGFLNPYAGATGFGYPF